MRVVAGATVHPALEALAQRRDVSAASICSALTPVGRCDEIEVVCRARSFLHNQVRSFVGTLKQVGEGKWTRRSVEKALAAADRTACGPVAPPDGLYLLQVDYE